MEKLERLLVDYSILTSKIQSLESQFTLFNSSISNLNQKYNDLSESIENLSSDNSLDEIESLQAEIEKLKVDISNIKNVIEVYAELRERITVLENNVSTSEEDIKDLEQQDIINNITWGDRSITLWNENKPQYSCRIDAVSYVEYDWTAGKTTYKKNGEYLPFDYDFTYYYVYIIPGGSQNTNRTWYKKDLSKCLLFNGSVSEYSFSTSLPYLPNKDSAFDEFLADFLSNIGE